MLHRFRSSWLAGGGALLLVLSMSGLAAAASLVSDTSTHTQDATLPAGDGTTLLTFVDVNGNGIDDACEPAPAADTVAAAAAFTAADLDGDGTISVTEAAQTGWVGGTNCNHGGYVSSVAQTSTDTCDQSAETADTTDESADESKDDSSDGTTEDSGDQATDPSTTTVATTTTTTTTATTTTCTQSPTDPATDAAPAVCPVIAPVVPTDVIAPIVDTAPNAHGTAVSTVAQSAAVGGKNCNHGGAVSEAAKAAHGLKPDQAAKRAAHLAKHLGKVHGGQH
jgi:hypothetical protein